ncbi:MULTISPECIES: hypothetical protein [unclassified Microcoleus]|uniref:hypothetical protein n=1 Tax=unclassified Microcoleus TaxID=2642155 RepID=UPI002FD6C437
MKFRAISLFFATCAIAILSLVFTPPAWARTQITLSDLSYHECPAQMAEGTVTSGSSMEANCFLITGKAENSSGKLVVNADIFGRIYDADDNPVMQNRTRLGSIEEVPPGVSDFQVRISVAANQPTPLKLKQFKATGFTGVVRR